MNVLCRLSRDTTPPTTNFGGGSAQSSSDAHRTPPKTSWLTGRSPEPDDTGGRAASVQPAAGGFTATSPIFPFFTASKTDVGLERFCTEETGYSTFLNYMTGIRKVAGYLANVKKNDKGEYSYTPDPNSPEDVREFGQFVKSKILMGSYKFELKKETPDFTGFTFFVDSQMGQTRREIFVVVTIAIYINQYQGADAWFDYLRFIGSSDLKSLRDQSEREQSPHITSTELSTPRPGTPDYRNTSPQITDTLPGDGTDTNNAGASNVSFDGVFRASGPAGLEKGDKYVEKRDTREKRNVLKKSGTESPNSIAKHNTEYMLQQKARRSKLYQHLRENQEKSKTELQQTGTESTGIDPPKTGPPQSEAEVRQLLYTEDKIQQKWRAYSAQITTLTHHLKLMIDEDKDDFPEGSESVTAIMNSNDYTRTLYNLLLDFIQNQQDLNNQLQATYNNVQVAYEHVIVHAMQEECEEYEDPEKDYTLCSGYPEWKAFLEKIKPNVTDRKELLAMRLGSELHTLDFMQNLTRRVQALQDW